MKLSFPTLFLNVGGLGKQILISISDYFLLADLYVSLLVHHGKAIEYNFMKLRLRDKNERKLE